MPFASADGLGEDELGHQLSRLDHRCVAVLQQLDPAYPAGEELVRAISISCWMWSLSAWFIRALY
jgi:hypothetical protein